MKGLIFMQWFSWVMKFKEKSGTLSSTRWKASYQAWLFRLSKILRMRSRSCDRIGHGELFYSPTCSSVPCYSSSYIIAAIRRVPLTNTAKNASWSRPPLHWPDGGDATPKDRSLEDGDSIQFLFVSILENLGDVISNNLLILLRGIKP